MKVINATTIGILISAHMEGDEERSAIIIRKRIDGSYKNEPQVCSDRVIDNMQ